VIVLEEAPEAIDDTFLLSALAGGVVGDAGQMGMFAASQTADQRDQGLEVAFAMPGRTRLLELHNGLFYDTIAAIRVTHGMHLLTERSIAGRSIPWVARIRI